MNNKCVVISGINKDVTPEEFQTYVNDIAGREINCLHIVPLNKADSWWRTIALELSEEDYLLLNNPEIWAAGIRIRDFRGWKFWRGNNRRRFDTPSSRIRESWGSSS